MNSLLLILLMVAISYGSEEKLKVDDISHTKRNKDGPKQADQRRMRGKCMNNRMYNCNFVKRRCYLCEGRRAKSLCPETCRHCLRYQKKCGISTTRVRRSSRLYPRIVNGNKSGRGYFPWQVAVYYQDSFYNVYFQCGGTLIDHSHVMSAAHCFQGMTDVKKYRWFVVLGEYNRDVLEGSEQDIRVIRITIHEKFNYRTLQNDIAILQLQKRAKETKYTKIVCLPEQMEEKEPGSMCWLSGWGKEAASLSYVSKLQEQETPVVDHTACNARNKNLGRIVTENMICTGYANGLQWGNGCHGDSGGPLSCMSNDGSWKVYGIVSWGNPQCNGLAHYSVYTKVASYMTWIREHTSCFI